MREAIFTALGLYLEREGDSWHADLDVAEDAGMGAWLDAIGARRDLPAVDREGDGLLAKSLAALPKDDRRQLLLAYLGYPFYDIATRQLGRASCRERRGQYGSISVVPGSLKKKKRKNTT